MKSTRQIDIYLSKKGNVRLIDVVQYDTGIHLVFTVKDFDIPSGATAKLYVQKPSGKFVFQEDGITIVDNTILIDLENQAITEHGKVPYQVSITNGSDMITTFTGLMMVEKSLKDSNATESKTVIRAFDEVVSDHVAEFQTKAEQIVQACIATIPKDYTVMEAKVNELASAIKGSLSGAVVFADDVSPVEHSPVVWVHGKNLIPYPYPQTTYTGNGGTFTAQADGGILASGTPTDYVSLNLYNGAPLAKSGNLVFSASGNYENVSISMVLYDGADNVLFNAEAWKGRNPISVNLDEYPAAVKWLVFIKRSSPNVEMTGKIYPQIELGDAATDYTPYIDPSTVTVSRCGRNLIPKTTESIDVQAAGITQSVSTNGSVKINGTATDPAYLFVSAIYNLPRAVYYLTGNTSDECLLIASAYNGEAYVFEAQDRGRGVILDLTDKTFDHVRVMMYVPAGNTVEKTIYPMLSIDQAGTEYEYPQEVTTHIPSSDGTISDLTSLSPHMTIMTDTAGAIVECEYNIDTKTYIDRKIKELMQGVK